MDIRERRESDLALCLEMAWVIKARDGYPPVGPLDIENFLAPAEQLAAWVAEADSTIVGHIALHAGSDYATTRLAAEYLGRPQSDLGLIARFFVDPGHRRSGVGRALLAQATIASAERGLHPVLDVATELTPAIALYESLGWRRAGRVVLEVWDEPPVAMDVYVAPAR